MGRTLRNIQQKEGCDYMNNTNLGVALVTGASTGIGHATAKALQNAGFRVFGTSRRAAAEISDGTTMLVCDVTDDESVATAVGEVLTSAGRIDLLVNNAGVGLLGGAEESSMAQAQALFDVNVFGVLRVTNAVLPIMRRQGNGRIVNLSSVQGFIPAPYFGSCPTEWCSWRHWSPCCPALPG
jgi:NADP-dependent 3-hydroxy acid dehydrogenase YdfG